MNGKNIKYKVDTNKSSYDYVISLEDCALVKRLLDAERFRLIECYGEGIYNSPEYTRLICVTSTIDAMIKDFLEDDWKEFNEWKETKDKKGV